MRSSDDVRAFELWQYVHLPLCLGLAIGGHPSDPADVFGNGHLGPASARASGLCGA